MDLRDRVILVTGAGGNLGEAVVRAALESGAKVAALDSNAEHTRAVLASEETNPNLVILSPQDLTTTEGAEAAVREASEHFPPLDGVMHTVGGFSGGVPLTETDLDSFQAMFLLNSVTTFNIAKATIPIMTRKGAGSFVAVGAMPALKGVAGLSAYSAAKAAVLRTVETLAAEVGSKGVRVNAIIPGTIDTPQNRAAMPGADTSRWVAPEAIADAVVFLLSDAARAVHGAHLPVAGAP